MPSARRWPGAVRADNVTRAAQIFPATALAGRRRHRLAQPGHAQASQLVHGSCGPVRVGRAVPDHQLKWPSDDPAGVIDVANRHFKSSEQVPARLHPAGPSQRNESADPDG